MVLERTVCISAGLSRPGSWESSVKRMTWKREHMRRCSSDVEWNVGPPVNGFSKSHSRTTYRHRSYHVEQRPMACLPVYVPTGPREGSALCLSLVSGKRVFLPGRRTPRYSGTCTTTQPITISPSSRACRQKMARCPAAVVQVEPAFAPLQLPSSMNTVDALSTRNASSA